MFVLILNHQLHNPFNKIMKKNHFLRGQVIFFLQLIKVINPDLIYEYFLQLWADVFFCSCQHFLPKHLCQRLTPDWMEYCEVPEQYLPDLPTSPEI